MLTTRPRMLDVYSLQVRTCCVNGPLVWNGFPLQWRFLSRTLSDTLYRRIKLFFLTVLEFGSASE